MTRTRLLLFGQVYELKIGGEGFQHTERAVEVPDQVGCQPLDLPSCVRVSLTLGAGQSAQLFDEVEDGLSLLLDDRFAEKVAKLANGPA